MSDLVTLSCVGAGRRGKDDKGLCIMMVEDTLDAATCKQGSSSLFHPFLPLFRAPLSLSLPYPFRL